MYATALERVNVGIPPPNPRAPFENFCSQNAEYLKALRTLDDADIDEAQQPARGYGVSVTRVETAVRGLRLGDGVGCGFALEQYNSFLERANNPEHRMRHELLHVARVCGHDAGGNALVQIDGLKLAQAVAVGDLEAVMMHLITQLDRAATQRYSLVLFHYNSSPDAKSFDAKGSAGSSSEYSAMYSMLELYEKKLDPKFGRNVQSIVVVHPTYSLKIALRFFAPFVSEALQSKLIFASSLALLEQLVEFHLLRIPLFALDKEEVVLQELRDSEMKPLQDLQLRPAGRVTQVLAAGNDSEFEEYVCAASSVLQDNWRLFARQGSVDLDAEEEIRAALAAFDLNGKGLVAADDLRYALGALGNYPLSDDELNDLIALGGGGEHIQYETLSSNLLSQTKDKHNLK